MHPNSICKRECQQLTTSQPHSASYYEPLLVAEILHSASALQRRRMSFCNVFQPQLCMLTVAACVHKCPADVAVHELLGGISKRACQWFQSCPAACNSGVC